MPKITLKRVTNADGTTADLYPTTTLDQIISEGTGAGNTDESLSSYIDARFILASQKGATNGVAPLESGKVPETYLPNSVFGGMTFVGTISASSANQQTNLEELISGTVTTNFTISQQLDDVSGLSYGSDGSAYDNKGQKYLGHYWIVSGSHALRLGYDSGESGVWNNPIFDDGDDEVSFSGSNKTLETGDWVIITGWDNTNKRWTFNVINNTYKDANGVSKGVVQLSAATSTSALTDGNTEVITEDGLYGMLVADNSDLSGTTNSNKIAPAAHHHDGIYYTQTALNNIFDGTTSTTGYNRANWDTAYGWGDHSQAGYLTSQTSHADVLVDGDFSSAGLMKTDGSGTYSIVTDNSSNWDDAYGWGDHSTYTDPVKFLNGNIPSSGNTVGTIFLHQDS